MKQAIRLGNVLVSDVRSEDAQEDVRIPYRNPLRADGTRVGRNDACVCGSGRKFKHCCVGKR